MALTLEYLRRLASQTPPTFTTGGARVQIEADINAGIQAVVPTYIPLNGGRLARVVTQVSQEVWTADEVNNAKMRGSLLALAQGSDLDFLLSNEIEPESGESADAKIERFLRARAGRTAGTQASVLGNALDSPVAVQQASFSRRANKQDADLYCLKANLEQLTTEEQQIVETYVNDPSRILMGREVFVGTPTVRAVTITADLSYRVSQTDAVTAVAQARESLAAWIAENARLGYGWNVKAIGDALTVPGVVDWTITAPPSNLVAAADTVYSASATAATITTTQVTW